MNLRQIEVFRAVMLTGSVSQAARLLNVSQPGVSRTLAHLELHLGIALFLRRKGKLLATPEARVLFGEVEQVYGGVKRIEDCAEALKRGEQMTLRLAASPSTMLELIPRVVTQLVEQYPRARVTMDSIPVPDMLKHLLAHEIDVAISTVPLQHELLSSMSVGKWKLVCAMPAGHPFEKHRSVHLKDVLRGDFVGFAPDTIQGRLFDEWDKRSGSTSVSALQVRSGQNATALVAHGAGLAVVDEMTALSNQDDRVRFRPLHQAPVTDLNAIFHAHVAPSQLSQALTKLLTRELKKMRG